MLNLSKIKAAWTSTCLLMIALAGVPDDAFCQPIGGFVNVIIDDGKDVTATYQITVIHHESIQPIDDSLMYQFWPLGGGKLKKVNAAAKLKKTDGYTALNYTINYEGLTAAIPNSGNFMFLYINDKNQQDTLYLESWLNIGSGGYFSSADYVPPIVYHHPAQELSIGFLKQQELYNWPDLPIYSYSLTGNPPPIHGLKILAQTGNIIAGKNTLQKSFRLGVANSTQSKYMYKYSSTLGAYIIVDSSLTGYFNYDASYKNNSGFINVVCEAEKQVQFNFDYIDADADSVLIACNYSHAHLGTNINYTTTLKSDTFAVSMNNLITAEMYKQLPQQVNFIVYPYKNQLTKPRCFSINLVKDFNTGLLSEQAANKSKTLIYPNPASGAITISDHEHIISIRFINILGQEVLKHTNPTNSININELAQGVYLIEVVSADKKVSYERLVKE